MVYFEIFWVDLYAELSLVYYLFLSWMSTKHYFVTFFSWCLYNGWFLYLHFIHHPRVCWLLSSQFVSCKMKVNVRTCTINPICCSTILCCCLSKWSVWEDMRVFTLNKRPDKLIVQQNGVIYTAFYVLNMKRFICAHRATLNETCPESNRWHACCGSVVGCLYLDATKEQAQWV